MDGLSAAASGMAVVSLAIQLVGSVRDIRRFLGNVSDAPKELGRLIDLLEQLELILENIGAQVENQRRQNGDRNTAASEMVLRAMKTCESKLKMLEDVVMYAKKTASATSKTTRALGSFKFACKKKDLEGFESQLHDAVSLLNLTITANLTAVHSESIGKLMSEMVNTNQLTSIVTKELVLLRTNQMQYAAQGRDVNLNDVRRSQQLISTSQAQYVTTTKHSGVWGTFVKKRLHTMQRSNQRGQNVESYNRSETTWIFLPSFFSSCVELKYMSILGSVKRSLRTYPLLPHSHPVWNICKNGNLKGLQALLSERQVSPFSVDISGNSLLHYSSSDSHAEICKFLFDLGLNGQETSVYGYRPFLLPPQTITHIPKFKQTFSLFASKLDDADAAEVCSVLFSSRNLKISVEIFNDMVRHFVSKDTINLFQPSPILMAMRLLWTSDPGHSDAWKQAIRNLIALGADLQKSSDDYRHLLDDILNMATYPHESIELGREWLDALRSAGVDVVEYLRGELQYRRYDSELQLTMLQPHRKHNYRERYLVISEDPPKVSWEWFIDPEGSAFDVLEEFKNFGPGSHGLWSAFESSELARDWNWPFFYPGWQYCVQIRGNNWAKEEYIAIARRAEERFERRWYKKVMKLARAQGLFYKGPKIPGGWID